MFFNERNKRDTSYAKRICNRCPVKEECGDHAIKSHTYHGIWGGMDSKEIEVQRRVRKIVLPPQYGVIRANSWNA